MLNVLARWSEHGYSITLRIEHLSTDALSVEGGSLYPALHREAEASSRFQLGLGEEVKT